MGPYNGFTGEQRLYGEQLIKQAIIDGLLLPKNRTKCIICGQDKGIRDYHAEDYSPENIINDVVPICRHCHIQLHRYKNKNPKMWQRYLDKIARGKRYPPTYNWYWKEEDDYHGDDENTTTQVKLDDFKEK